MPIITRRQFLGSITGAILILPNNRNIFGKMLEKQTPIGYPDIAHIQGGTVFNRVKTAINSLGGIAKFVKPHDSVVIKPNAAFAQTPEMGGNTTPEVIEAVIKLCKQANAGSVTIVEHCLSNNGIFGTTSDYSGITQVALKEGVFVLDAGVNPHNYENIKLDAPHIPWHGFIKKFLEADVVINVPRAKTHPITGYTLSVKNLMGTMQNPKLFHLPEGQSNGVNLYLSKLLQHLGMRTKNTKRNALLPVNLVALATLMRNRITLNIIDMTHLVRDWSAERRGKLERRNTIIAGTNRVSVDAYCVSLFGENPLGNWKLASIDNYIRLMHEARISNADIKTLSVKKIFL